MINRVRTIRIISIFLAIILALIYIYVYRSGTLDTQSDQLQDESTLVATITTKPLPTNSLPHITPTGTVTDTLLIAPTSTVKGKSEVIIISKISGGNYHLFIYGEEFQEPIQLGYGEWDDIMPVISPTGEMIAFSSNRSGYWDIYVLFLFDNSIRQITNSKNYDGHPTFSPDGIWMAFESYTSFAEDGFDIFLVPMDKEGEIFSLIGGQNNDHSPEWSSGGENIAFVSNRTGMNEIWVIDIVTQDQKQITKSINSSQDSPVWVENDNLLFRSSDSNGMRSLETVDITTGNRSVLRNINSEMFTYVSENHSIILVENEINGCVVKRIDHVNMESTITITEESGVKGIASGHITSGRNIQIPDQSSNHDLTSVNDESRSIDVGIEKRSGLVKVIAGDNRDFWLSDRVDESFYGLREEVLKRLKWDLLGTLENAFVPITSSLPPGYASDWLYTGRAISFGITPFYQKWMVVQPEIVNDKLYWRVFAFAGSQDGSSGIPLGSAVWRSNVMSDDYEEFNSGFDKNNNVEGYWIDVTDLVFRFGWERVPALDSWHHALSSSRFNILVDRQGLDWNQAILELYPEEIFESGLMGSEAKR